MTQQQQNERQRNILAQSAQLHILHNMLECVSCSRLHNTAMAVMAHVRLVRWQWWYRVMAHARWHTVMAHSDGTGHTQPASGRTLEGFGCWGDQGNWWYSIVCGVYMVHWCMYTRGQGNVGLCLKDFTFTCCYLGVKFGKKLQIWGAEERKPLN